MAQGPDDEFVRDVIPVTGEVVNRFQYSGAAQRGPEGGETTWIAHQILSG